MPPKSEPPAPPPPTPAAPAPPAPANPPAKPPAHSYKARGKFDTIPGVTTGKGGMKCYITGPPTATKAIIFIYDIFGYYSQTLQGADILAYKNPKTPYRVFMPDLYSGTYMDMDLYNSPTKSPEQSATMKQFWDGPGNKGEAYKRLPLVVEAIKRLNPGLTDFAAIGACWGARIIAETSKIDSPFKCAVQMHPAFLQDWDANDITIPTALLPSATEIKDASEKEAVLKTKNGVVVPFKEMHHGWMTAKAQLHDPVKSAGYYQGYDEALKWFRKYL